MNIVINGGTKGIGREIVTLLSSDGGNKILVTGRSSSILDELSAAAWHRNIITYLIDLESFEYYRDQLIQVVSHEFKHIDILINNAGTLVKKDFMDIAVPDARKMMETNFWGPALFISALKPFMKRGSHIVNISSMSGYQGSKKFKGMSYYSASKAALSCLSECLSEEFRNSGITVNCLALGAVQTEMFREAFPGYTAPVSAAEMAQFIVDFAASKGRFMNGQVIPVALNNP